MNDDIAEEIRSIRRTLSRRFDFDVQRICAELISAQQRSGHTYLAPPTPGDDSGEAERELAPHGASPRRCK